MKLVAVTVALWVAAAAAAFAQVPPALPPLPGTSGELPGTSPGAGPVIVIETDKGLIELETYPDDAPKTVAHVLELVQEGFYDGLRFHRVEPGFIVQFGDPKSRDPQLRTEWGRAPGDGSGTPVAVAEFSRRRTHATGAVGLAHAGDPTQADSQIYITLAGLPQLDGRFVVFGQVLRGSEVLERLAPGDVVRRVSLR